MSINYTARTWVTGEVVTAAEMNTEIRDPLNGVQAAWTAWVPTLTNLTIGNGTISARWTRLGKSILARMEVIGGTTTSVTGAVSSTLPVAAHATASQTFGGLYAATASGTASLSFGTGGSTAAWQYAAPSLTNVTVFGNTHVFRVQGWYEAA